MITRRPIYAQHSQVLLTCDECDWVTASIVQLSDYHSITHQQVCPRTGSVDANGVPRTAFH